MKLFITPFLLCQFAISTCLAMDFRPPTSEEALLAIGNKVGLSRTLQRAFEPGTHFEPVPVPQPSDWLAEHYEAGQTFDAYIRLRFNRPNKQRNIIYLQPLGDFPPDRSPSIKILKTFTQDYFMMASEILPSMNITGLNIRTRINPATRNRQVLSTDVLAILKRTIPSDAYCVLAITMEDLYPHPSWNFVFGQASPQDRVGVFSFARYDPTFYGDKRGEHYKEILMRRSCKVLAHEIGHMFSMAHCIFFRCVMNGSNHLDESDQRPLSLCPVCLRKLQFAVGFDVVARYVRLLRFYQKAGLKNEAVWTSDRLKFISPNGFDN